MMTQTEALRLALEALERIDLWLKARYQIGLVGAELEAITAIKAALEAKDEPVAIKWEKDADKECRYNNWVGMTPFGRILITWKGWKEWHDACVDEFPGGFEAYGLPDDVKAACEVEYLRRLYTTPPQRKPLTDDEITLIIADCASSHQHTDIHLARAIEQAHGITG